MKSKFIRTVSKFLISGILFSALLFFSSCDTWMSNDDFMSEIESEVHDANAEQISVYVRYANAKMGSTEPQGRTTMKVDVASKISAITSDDYGFVKWAAFSTNDFHTDKQHSKLTFLSEQDYNENYKTKELPSSVVSFSNPKSPATEVKILSARSDIFIIPIVATRPSYVQSVPANADNNVVKNTSIRILFSKAIDKKTLYDEEGNVNYSITTGVATLTDDSEDMEAKDITDYFAPTLSESGKMLTLKLKEKEDKSGQLLLDNRQRITVTLLEGLCDLYGFAMNGNYTFSFLTGTNTDSLAPMIEVLYGGGTGAIENVFVSFLDGQIDGKATDAAKNAPKDINNSQYTDALVAQRVFDKVNLYVKSTDIIASGNIDINPAKDLSEDNVAYIGISASLYIDKDGKAITPDPSTTIAKKNYVYIAGQLDADAEENPLFTEKVPLSDGGTIYTYDVSSLPDGLIKIDVWGIDMTGNSGGPNDPGSPYYGKHDNGYKSIFVVKDTTEPDSEKEAVKVKSNSALAPYFWYNSETLNSMELYDLESNQIVDSGHAKLRSLVKNLQWNFVVGKTTKEPAKNDSGWKFIHDKENGSSIKYGLDKANPPSSDGPVDITMFIRDDIGNVSKPVVLNSIMYDNTKPTVTLLNDYGDFVNEEGGKELHSSKDPLIPQILKVAFTEPNVDNNGSGIRRIEIHVKKDNNEVSVPLDQNAFKVKWSTEANAIPKNAQLITVATDDTASTNNLKVFNVNDSSKITTGTLFIYGLTLGNEDGTYEVSVDLFDSAMNKTTATAKTKISRDKTSPKINTVKIQDAKSRVVYGDATGTKTWWMPKEKYESGNLTKVALTVASDEEGSGLETIKVGNDVEFTSATILKKGNVELTKGTDYKFDENDPTHTIILLNNYDVQLKGTPIEFTLENVKLKSINNGAGNKINIEVKDFVGNTPASNNIENTSDYQIVYPDNTTGTLVYADNTPPSIATDSTGKTTLHVEDTAHNSTKNPDNKAYDKDNYTDSRDVILTLKLTAESVTNGSGVKTIHLTDNAVFTDSTAIFIDNSTTPLNNADYTFADDKKSVDFTKVFTADNQIKFTNVRIISETPGAQIIKADLTDFVGLKSTASTNTNTIVVDNTDPVIDRINWVTDQAGVTIGSEGDWIIDTQKLKINFIEATAGVKAIKFDIHLTTNSTNTFEYPFEATGFELYYNSTKLEKNNDYIIDTNKQYIILTEPKTSGFFEFKNIQLTNTNEQGNYAIDVKLLDAAENVIDCTKSIAIDNEPPVVTGKLLIKDLVHSKELYSGEPALAEEENMPGTGHHWLRQSYVGSGTDKAADSIPVIITIEENNSGIKVITFGEDAVLSSNTQLWRVDSHGNDLYDIQSLLDNNGNQIQGVEPVEYTVDIQKNTITIDDSINALNANGDNLEFKILVKNVGLKTEKTDTSTTASKNRITVKVQDVAMHDSGTPVDTYESYIYSDSRIPASPTNFKLLDRAYSKTAATPTIAASENYTNDSIVDMEFELSDSEKFGSGYHMFRISGAKFTADSVITMTTNGSEIKLNNSAIPFVISSSDPNNSNKNDILTLKTTGANADNYVVRQAVKVKITNVQLLNGNLPVASGSEKEVLLTAYDLIGRYGSAASDKIWFDDTPPEFEKIFTANYTDSSISYYKPSINVYPHPTGTSYEDATGVTINYGTDTEPLYVPTFYTATYYDSGLYQVNGQVSSTSSSVNTTFTHGAVLGIRAKDTTQLGGLAVRNNGDTSAKTFLYYYHYSSSEAPFTKTKSQILTSGTNLSTDKRGYRSSTSSSNPGTREALWFGFQTDNNDSTANITGKYSFVIVDEAGNCSDVFHFAVVQDTAKPAKTDFNNRVLLQMPDNYAKVYTKNQATVAEASDFPVGFKADYINNTYKIRTKKFITKKTDNNYIIQLNLGGNYSADTTIKKLNNGNIEDASSTTAYTELDAKDISAPIEMYAVSTYYGSWPNTSDSTYKFSPVVPYGTTFPSGQTHNVRNYDENSSNLAYVLGHNYFGYESGRPESSAWKIPNQNVTWHSYKTGDWNTDTGNGIISKIDSNNNLLIKIPNDKSTAPVSIFLRDGCGNMEYFVCGLYEVSGKQVAVSFILDNKLGNATTSKTSDGGYAVTTPVIIQNPHLSLAASGDEDTHPWNGVTFKWNNQSGNAYKKIGDTSNYHDGVAEEFGFFKDKAKYATYYNPRLYTDADNYIKEYDTTATDKKKWAKLALTLQFESGNEEPVKFTSGADMPVLNTDNAENNDAYEYTCRTKLYCTTSTAVPTYTTIKNAALESSNPANVTGFATDWVGVKSVSGQVTICLDYPQPDYDRLGWIVNNSTTHEPVPYYMWYVFEDRVGNYEIGKVVNNRVTGSSLKNAPSPSGTVFDKWLYDGAAPVVTVVNTTKTPDQITNTQSDVSALISENNGFVPYLDTSNNSDYKNHTVWLNTSEQGLRNNARTPTGWGVTNQVEEYGSIITNRKYLPFANLTVSKEITGIRAFAWTINDKAPAYTAVASSGNTQGDRIDTDYPEGAWYAGFGQEAATEEKPLPGTKVDIGYGYTYKASDNYTNTTNSYLPNTTSGKTYYQKYSGTKINTIIPQVIVNNHPNTPLYLHVMDWTGNVKTYRMGSSTSDLKFKSDISYPSRHYTETGTKDKIRSVDNEWLVRAYTPNNITYIYVHIAGLGAGSSNATTGRKTMQIRLPDEYFTDADSGYKGFSLTRYDIGSVKRDTTGPYLEVDYNTYRNWSTNAASPTELTANFYDNVGNLDYWTLKCIYDINAPAISSVSLIPQSGTTLADTVNNVFTTTKPYTHPTSAGPHSDVSSWATGELQEVYVNTTNSSKFKFKITLEEDPGDFGEAKINKWNGTSWETIYSTKTSGFENTTDNVNYEMSNYLLDCTTEGTYYQIVVTDVSSNASYQYFKMIKDNDAPTLTKNASNQTIKPQIILGMGSVNSVTTGTGSSQTTTYYYTSDADHLLKLHFAVEDTGVGTQSALNTIKYCLTNSSTESDWTTISNNGDVTISIPNTVTAVETIYFKDIFGTVTTASAATPGFTYTYTDSNGTSQTEPISKLTKYTYSAPAAPEITEGEMTQTIQSGWSSQTVKYSIIQEIQTAGNGVNDEYEEVTYNAENPEYTHLYTQKLSGNTVLIKGKGDDEIERQKLKITFPTTNNKIIGYLKSDTPIQQPTDPATDANKYSFATLEHEFIEDLPLAGTDAEGNKLYTAKNRYYYAVDVVGNISPALNILYSYEDPHVAKDITFIMDPANSSESASAANYIDKDLKTQMINEGVYFANFVEGPSTVTDPQKKKDGILYFNDGWIILRCTLQEEAGGTYSETPRKVVMYDGYYDNNGKFKVLSRGESDSQYFKYYCLSEKNADDRYYCWIAFKPGKKKNNTWAVNNYDNNDEYDGAKIYFRITGTSSNSEYSRWNTDETSSNYDFGWKLDNEAPYIKNTNFYTTSDNKKILKSYVISDAANTVDSQKKFVNPIVKGYDNIDASKRETNLIPAGAKIYYQVRENANNPYFMDKYSGGVQFKFVSSEGYTATASAADSGWAALAMPQGISEDVNLANFNKKGQYYFTLPEVTEPNHYIALFFKDALGNVSEPYYLGDKSNGAIKTWLTNKSPASVNITKKDSTDAPTYVVGTESYELDLAIDSGNAGAVIKTIEAENASIESVTFNGYTSQPTFSADSGTFQNNEAWINKSGLKIKIKDVTQGWSSKTVQLKINDSPYTVFTVEPLTLGPSNIKINEGENPATWTSGTTEYELPITFDDSGAGIGNVSGIEIGTGDGAATGVTAEWPEGATTVTIKGVPGQAWSTQKVYLKINDTFTKEVFTIPAKKLSADNIILSPVNWVSGTTSYEVPVELKEGDTALDIGLLAGMTFSAGIDNSQVTLNTTTSMFSMTGISVTQGWEAQTVKITISGANVSGSVEKVALNVEPKNLSDADVDISDAENGVVTLSSSTGAPLATYITGVKAKVGNTEIGAALSENNTKVTLGELPAKTWPEQKVTLYINPTAEDADGIKSKDVFTIPAIQTTDISIGTAAWSDADNAYVATVTYSNGAPTSAITSVRSTKATAAFAKLADDTTDDTTKILITGLPAKTWASQAIDVTISDGGDTNKITKDDVYTVDALTEDDFNVSGPDECSSTGDYTIARKDNITLEDLSEGNFALTGEGSQVSWNSTNGTASITVIQTWATQTLTLSLKGITLKTITVPAKNVTEANIKFVTPKEGADLPAWNDNLSTLQFRITLVDVGEGVAVTSASNPTFGTLTTATGDVIGLDASITLYEISVSEGQKIPNDVAINIVTTNGSLTGVRFFPDAGQTGGNTDPEPDESIGSRAAFGGFKQTSASDVAVAGDAPKTRSISLRNWVADLFGGDSEAVDLAAGDAAPLTKKEAKKAQKAAKKAAKAAGALKAAESSAQPAAGLEDLVVAAAEAAGQTLDAAVSEAEAVAKPAQMEAEASAPVMSGLEPAAGEASAEEAAPSKAALFLAMAVFCAAIAGILIFCLKKKPAKK